MVAFVGKGVFVNRVGVYFFRFNKKVIGESAKLRARRIFSKIGFGKVVGQEQSVRFFYIIRRPIRPSACAIRRVGNENTVHIRDQRGGIPNIRCVLHRHITVAVFCDNVTRRHGKGAVGCADKNVIGIGFFARRVFPMNDKIIFSVFLLPITVRFFGRGFGGGVGGHDVRADLFDKFGKNVSRQKPLFGKFAPRISRVNVPNTVARSDLILSEVTEGIVVFTRSADGGKRKG